jgi:hypothetical protein
MVAWPGACRPETPCVGPTLGTIPSSPRYCLRRLQRSFSIHHILPKSAGRDRSATTATAVTVCKTSDDLV